MNTETAHTLTFYGMALGLLTVCTKAVPIPVVLLYYTSPDHVHMGNNYVVKVCSRHGDAPDP